MKKYTFNLNNNTTSYNTPFLNKSTDYSKTLDDLIFDDLIENNKWLGYKKTDESPKIIYTSTPTYTTYANPNSFDKAFMFFTNIGTSSYIPFEKDKYYELSDGTLFCISDNYIYMNGKFYWFNDIKKKNFFSLLTPAEKKTICTIYTDSLKITIKA